MNTTWSICTYLVRESMVSGGRLGATLILNGQASGVIRPRPSPIDPPPRPSDLILHLVRMTEANQTLSPVKNLVQRFGLVTRHDMGTLK